jgi:peptidoglycan hydrolase-like protein with peptidoglycan-binding domain
LFAGEEALATVTPTASSVSTTLDEFVAQVAQGAAEGQVRAGGRGVREGVEKALGERFSPAEARQLTDEILKGVSGEVRGGIGVRVPFIGRDAEGNIVRAGQATTRRLADVTPGLGRAVDDFGLRGVAEAGRSVINEFRSSRAYQRWSELMNGRFGAEYAALVRQTAGKGGGMDYATFKKLVTTDNERTARLVQINDTATKTLQAARNIVDQSPDKAASEEAAKRFYNIGEDAQLPANATDAERAGFEAAAVLRNYPNTMFEEVLDAAARAGVPVGKNTANNWIPRVLHPDEVKLRRSRGEIAGTYNPLKPRVFGYATDDLGELTNATPAQLNEQLVARGARDAGHQTFETDPFKVAAQQMAAYSDAIAKYSLIADLKTLDLIQAPASTVRLLRPERLVQRGRTYSSELASVLDRLSTSLSNATAAGNMDQVDRISKAIEKVAKDKTTIDFMLTNINAVDPQQVRMIGDLVRTMKSALAAGEEAGVVLTKAEKAGLFAGGKRLVREVGTVQSRELTQQGLRLIGEGEAVRLPRGISNLYASEAVRDAVERYYKIERGIGTKAVESFVDNIFDPLFTLFKTHATVGRPGGYQIRNLIGAWWNNWLGDVSVTDHNLSAQALKAAFDNQRSAQSAIENVRAGRPSGLSGEGDQLARYIVNLGKARGSSAVEYEVEQLTNFLTLRQLEKVKVGDLTMADVITAAREQGIMRGNRRLEYLRDQARAEGTELAEALIDPQYINLFRGKTRQELNSLQKAMNASVNFGYIRRSADAADMTENYVRLAAFTSGARRYGLADKGMAAGYLTKALQFDYSDLSEFERRYIKRAITFYTWTRKNLPLQFFAFVNQPGKFNALGAFQENAKAQFSADDDEVLANVMPEWVRERMGFATRYTYGGRPILASVESPAIDLNRYLAFGPSSEGFGRMSREAISASNPFFKALVEGVSGVDTFTGGKFTEKGSTLPFSAGPIDNVLKASGLAFTGPEGETRIDARSYNIIKDLLPPLGVILRVAGRGDEADRALTNRLSAFGGLPLATLTEKQATAELKSREDRLRKQIERKANALGVDKNWLREQVAAGATADSIRNAIAAGEGRRPATGR